MSANINSFQGGIPYLYTRSGHGQRGSGFFSSLKRFLIPIGKAVLPSVVGGVSDLVSGKSFGETAKKRGLAAGKDALGAAARVLGQAGAPASPPPPPSKKYKKGSGKAKRHKTNSSWK